MNYLRLHIDGTDVWLPNDDENRPTIERLAAATGASVESRELTRLQLVEIARDDSAHCCLRLQ